MDKNMNIYFDFLNKLRESNATNMFGATPYLLDHFPELTKDEARKILIDWINSFI